MMTRFRISYTIDGLNDVLETASREIKIDDVIFRTREKEKVGTIILESNEGSEIILKDALYFVDKALGKLCFAYNTEAQVKSDSMFISDLTHDPHHEMVESSLVIRTGYLDEDPQLTLSKITLIPMEKRGVLDLALAYYKLRTQFVFKPFSVAYPF